MRLQRNVSLYRWFQLFSFTPFSLSIIVLFWEQNGLDTLEIFLLQTIFSVAIVLLEVPTGMLADRVGKRASLLFGSATAAAAWGIYAVSSSFAGFLLAELVIAVGIAFQSGADAAFLYDSLKALGRESEFREREGSARSFQMLAFAVCALVGGMIGSHSFRLAVGLSCVGPLIAFGIVLAMKEASPSTKPRSFAEAWSSYQSLVRDSLRFLRKHRLIRWYIAYGAVLAASLRWLLWMYQPYMRESGFPVWAFGIAFATFNFVAAFSSRLAHPLAGRLGAEGMLWSLGGLAILPLLMMGAWQHPLSWLLILGHQLIRGVFRPVFSDWILAHTFADKRATVISLFSMAQHLMFALTAPVIGWVGKHSSISGTLYFEAALLVILLGSLVAFYGRIPAKYFVVKVRNF